MKSGSGRPKSSRSRNGTTNGMSSRGKGDGKGSGQRSNDGSGTSKSDQKTQDLSSQAPMSLKSRQELLASILVETDHEYNKFAQFLSATYELTGNTDRQSSKDYIRLCNLKDNYHKQCKSDKDKLKIYKIKSFFSQILRLEVTGEWDRHNHGGVRGPYVYGIRLRQATNNGDAQKQGILD